MDTKLGVTKLNNSNYNTWKFKIEMLLSRDDLWDQIAAATPLPVTLEWTKRDRKAMATISLAVEDDQLLHIRAHGTAREMWEALKGRYERSSLTSKLYILRRLYQTRLKPNQDMDEHINAILALVESLREAGEDIKDNHVMAILLCSIPESYEALITALEARPEEELTLNYVKNKLIDEFRRRRENALEREPPHDSVLKTSERRNGKAPPKECFYCNKIGHIRRDCRLLKSNRPRKKSSQEVKLATAANDKGGKISNSDSQDYCFYITTKKDTDRWVIDSGATSHMSRSRDFFEDITFHESPQSVRTANGTEVKILGIGSGRLYNKSRDTSVETVLLKQVLFVPDLESNLLSVRKLTELGYTVTFEGGSCQIATANKTIIRTDANECLYSLNYSHKALLSEEKEHKNCIHDWHYRLGHRDPKAILKMASEGLAEGLTLKPCGQIKTCHCCIRNKTTIKTFPRKAPRKSKRPFELIHSDLCGPMQTPTIGGKKYAITFTDDFSRYSETYLMESKNETNQVTQNYVKKWANYFKSKPHAIRTDGGGEYVNEEMKGYLASEGIHHQRSAPYSPQQNGIAERKNRHLVEMTRCMLEDAKLSNAYWGEGILTASYLQNRTPHSIHGRTPYELWFGGKPNISHIYAFGSLGYVHPPNEKLSKLEARTIPGILMGYDSNAKAYRMKMENGRIMISRNVTFVNPPNDQTHVNENEEPQEEIPLEIKDESTSTDDTTEITSPNPIEPRRSQRSNKGIPAPRLALLTSEDIFREPKSFGEIDRMEEPNRTQWLKAIDEELTSFDENSAWEIVPLPTNKKAIGHKWTFKLKRDEEGNPTIRRARLVAKGYSQVRDIDYYETYAPVMQYQTLRALLTVAGKKRMTTCHLDVKSAFLNGDLKEELYMTIPEGMRGTLPGQMVCKLKKAIYGLKQSAHAWNQKMNATLLDNGFTRSEADKCLYIKQCKDTTTYVLLYVDDLLICSNDPQQIKSLSNKMENSFKMKNLGPISQYLGIKIDFNGDDTYTLSQTDKIESLVEEHSLADAKDQATPMEVDFLRPSSEFDKYETDIDAYRKLIGSLLYIAIVSRPDISAAVGFLGRRSASPSNADWKAAMRVLKYLKFTKTMGLKLGGPSDLTLIAYSDADWAGDSTDRKSTSGQVLFLGNSAISWKSRKQTCTATSSTEAEYVAASITAQEVLWTRQLLMDLRIECRAPTIIHEDNQSCIRLSESAKTGSRSKHIDVRYHMIRDLQAQKIIDLKYCDTNSMIADILTKPLGKTKYLNLRDMLGLCLPCCRGGVGDQNIANYVMID